MSATASIRAAAGIVVVLLSIGCGGTPPASGTSSPSPAGSAGPSGNLVSPTPALSPAPTPAVSGFPDWTRVSTTDPLRGATMRRVVAGPSGALALGGGSQGEPGFVSWWSRDGTTWSRTGYAGVATAGDAIALPDGFVILGKIGDDPEAERAMTWRSSDGAQWTGQPIGDLRTSPIAADIVGGRIATFAVRAPSGGEPTLAWSSADLLTWSSGALGGGGYSDAAGLAVIADGSGLAFGRWSVEPMDTAPFPPGQAAIWSSTDGLAWNRLPDDPDLHDAVVLDVAQFRGAAIVAVGQRWDAAGSPDQAFMLALWSSSDGASWERAEAPATLDPTTVPQQIVDTPTGYFLLASQAGRPNALVARSTDGRTWTALDPPVEFGGDQINDVAVLDGRPVAVGETVPAEGTADAAVWLGTSRMH